MFETDFLKNAYFDLFDVKLKIKDGKLVFLTTFQSYNILKFDIH